MKRLRLVAGFFGALFCALSVAAAPPQLKFVAIVSRHGVRAPTWDAKRLNQYSSQPWPNWGVAPGYLTPHGRLAIERMGVYYRDWLLSENLLSQNGCQDADQIYVWADTDQRTLETGRAFADSLLPGCKLGIHSRPEGEKDSIFSGAGSPNPEKSLEALQARLGSEPAKSISDLRPSLETLQSILSGGQPTAKSLPELPAKLAASLHGHKADLDGPFDTASTLSEDLLLEYTDGMRGDHLGWGRLSEKTLNNVMELHEMYADVTRRTPYLARARGSNLLEHVLLSLEQAETGKALPGALGGPGDRVLILVGHDTNLSAISGTLGISWRLRGYPENATPPGAALIFSLWRDPGSGSYFVATEYVAQSLDQMRDATPLSMSAPPLEQHIPISGCDSGIDRDSCSWPSFIAAFQRAIDPAFISTTNASPTKPASSP